MRTLKIPFPDISFYEKTRLQADPGKERQLTVPSGSSSLYFRNPVGFSANDWAIIEAFESEDAEVVQVGMVDKEAHLIDLKAGSQTYQDHPVGVIVMKTPYNKVRIYRGTTATVADHTEILESPFNLRPDVAYTYAFDSTGLSTHYYSYAYVNSGTIPETVTDRILYTESDYDTILTVDQLKNWFMFGLDLTDDDGYPFPNSMFVFAIKAAVDSLEKTLQLKIKPATILQEYQDFYAQDYRDFAFIQLNNWPIISVERVQIKYPTAHTPIDFPQEWYQIRKERGQVHLVPTSGSLSTILMGKGGDYLTFVWRGYDFMPNLWRIDYTAGFETGKCPNDIIAIAGKMACFYPLNIAGDLVGGVAIASKSIGVDGLSQSINTTSSAENAGYSARLRQYERELKIEIPRLQQFYKAMRVVAL